ncbi:unnamed protein product [Microthlaspi erraticum]|uniref:Aspergillus nuclease S1 n=1 Tax=Microthlaspi erraticum TaxID=1685480 RepID=A0A6D2IPG8_9BRAS|nr:unnamed protein product [Microthlaspi erraticum]
MRLSLKLCIASVIVLTQLVCGALCWGRKGYFTKETAAAVKKLLPESAKGDLASVCSWPDEIQRFSQWQWTKPLHYVNINFELYRRDYNYMRDCKDSEGNKDMCVTGAIYNYTNQLVSASVRRELHFY